MIHYVHHDRRQNRILVKSEDSKKDDRFRYLPGSRWLPAKRMWSLPATPVIAWVVMDACGTDDTDRTENFAKLLAEGNKTEMAESVREALELPPIPLTKYTPWLHQLQAYHFAKPLTGCMLAMDMGTGKTKVTYDLIQNDPDIRRVLIGCPKAVIDDAWGEQFLQHWADGDGTVPLLLQEGTQYERALRAYDYLTADGSDRRIIILNYEVLWQPTFFDMAMSVEWDLVALDESHRIRSAGGITSRHLFRLGERAAKRLCLSGTPLANGPQDVFGQYRFLDAGIFGTNKVRFQDEFCLMGGYGGFQVKGYRNLDEFNRRFFSIAFRVTEDVLDLPPKHDIFRKTNLDPASRRVYKELDKEFTVELDKAGGSVTASNVLVKLIRCQQLTSGYVKNDQKELVRVGNEKALLLEDVLKNLDLHEPLIVFAQFHPEIDDILRIIRKTGRTAGELSGRRTDKNRWKAGDLDVLVVQIDAGSLGVDFTRARYAIFYSLGHDLELYQQARKRVHRPKQRNSVVFLHLLVRNTVDIKVMAALRAKRNIIEYIYNLNKKAA